MQAQHPHLLHDAAVSLQLQRSLAGWSGPRSKPVSKQTLRHLLSLIQALPQQTQPCTVGSDTAGDMYLEWLIDQRNVLLVSVNARNVITITGRQHGKDFRQGLGLGAAPLYQYLQRVINTIHIPDSKPNLAYREA